MTPDHPKPWAERFDEEFGVAHWKENWIYRDGGATLIRGIKSFIAEVEAETKATAISHTWERAEEMVEKYRKAIHDFKGGDYGTSWEKGYDRALQDLSAKIQEARKQTNN